MGCKGFFSHGLVFYQEGNVFPETFIRLLLMSADDWSWSPLDQSQAGSHKNVMINMGPSSFKLWDYAF